MGPVGLTQMGLFVVLNMKCDAIFLPKKSMGLIL